MGEVGGLRSVSLLSMLTTDIWMEAETSPIAILWRIILTLTLSGLCVALASSLFRRKTHQQLPGLFLILIVFAGAVLSWFVMGIDALAFDLLRAAWLPTLTYTLLSFGETMIIMQSSMTDVLKEEYINTAYAKGLPVPVVRERHAARNALLPVLSRLVISLPYLITGVVIVESSFGWPGMGTNMWNALYWQNMPVVMATLLLVGVLSLVARLALDVLIAYMDPRIRYDQQPRAAL
jgi:peptide/nickel transport system permease protein